MGTHQEKLTSEAVITTATSPPKKMLGKLRRLSWQVWTALLVLVFGGIGFSATLLLFKLSGSPNCPEIFWPIASASMRLYCAELEAEKRSSEGLLKAIALVEALPQDHPLRPEVDRLVETWAEDLLKLAEVEWQAGRIEKAVELAQQVPSQAKAYSLVEEQIKEWRATWGEGETLFRELEAALRKSNWNQGFRIAVKMLNLGNQHWASVKYDQAVQKIYLAREESSKLDQAFLIFNQGGLDNWLKALAEAKKIPKESYAYQEAQNLTQKVREKLLDYGLELVQNHSWQKLRDLVSAIPEEFDLDHLTSDWQLLANAGIDGEFGSLESLKAAIASAENIQVSSPVYEEAQKLLQGWRQEIEDVLQLAKARELAEPGSIESLNAAIAQARLLTSGNKHYEEAQREIRNWRNRIEVSEDQPILDKARTIAVAGDSISLRSAIAEVRRISSNRALYSEAQQSSREWQEQIERLEDQPILNQAIALGEAKDYQAALNTARPIARGRALSLQARDYMQRWQEQVDAQKNLEKAYLIAETQTSDAFIRALRLLRRIPASVDINSQRVDAMNNWSYKLLSLASEQANLGLYQEAIAMASKIPSESIVYNTAQTQITLWQQELAATLTPPEPLPESETPEIIPAPLP
jgi:hypothetical protein